MTDSSKAVSIAADAQADWQVSRFIAAEHGPSYPHKQPRPELRSSFVAEMMIRFTDFSLWFSLPLSIWLTTGWVGLIFHWRAISELVCQMENAPRGCDARCAAICHRLS